jgi:RNA polymerase sigma factor (sigma-70 family)
MARHSPPDEKSKRLAHFLREHHARLIRFLLHRGANHADAQDVAQKAYLAVLAPGVNFLGKQFPKAYLWTVALREWAHLHKRQQSEQQQVLVDSQALESLAEQPEHVDVEDLSAGLVLNEAMARAYASLSRDEKLVCNLLIEGWDAEEIAKATGLSPDQTERSTTRVRKRLKGLSGVNRDG